MEGEVKKKQSELGIASFIITICVLLLWCNFLGLMGNWHISKNISLLQGALLLFGLPFISLILGIIGLFQKVRRKIFPILGIVFSIFELAMVGFSSFLYWVEVYT